MYQLIDPDVQGNIINFGALPDRTDSETRARNCRAFEAAIEFANNGTFGADRRVLIPAGHSFFVFKPGCEVNNLTDIIVQIDARVMLQSPNITKSKYEYHKGKHLSLFYHEYSKNLTYRGTGEIDGQGWLYWTYFSLGWIKSYDRPKLINWN